MVSVKSLPFEYQVRRSVRAKKTRIVIAADKIEVVIPNDFSVNNAHEFVCQSQEWIIKTLAKIRSRQQGLPLAPKRFIEGAMIPYRGQSWLLRLKATRFKRIKIEFSNQFLVYIPVTLADHQVESEIRLALIKWLKKSARTEVETLVAKHQDNYQLTPNSIRIKNQKSRWGSCGIHNDININWVLILAAPEILEYVVVHELCHIRHRNHSAEFWALVAKHMAEYKQHNSWLRDNGANLMLGL